MSETNPFLASRPTTLEGQTEIEFRKPQGFFADIADSYALGVWGQLKDEAERNYTALTSDYDPNFDPLDHVEQKYLPFAEDWLGASSQAELDVILRNIDENIAIRSRLYDYSFGYNLLLGVVTGVVDPINLLGPSVKGMGFLAGASKSALAYGSINAAQELTRHTLDPTSSTLETSVNIGAGYILTGLIGGGVGWYTKGRQPVKNLSPEKIKEANKLGDEFDEIINTTEDLSAPKTIDFENQDVKIVIGNTGKYDALGNYIPAFFRPKEAFKLEAQQEKISKAVDDILGDEIPVPDDPFVPITSKQLDDLEDPEFKPKVEETEDVSVQLKDGEPEDTIYIDDTAILASFENKPWTFARIKGVKPFEENAFATPAEWLNFIVRHEMHHKTTKKLKNESKADYENRINQLAYDDIKAGRMPLSPTDSALERAALYVQPEGRLNRKAFREKNSFQLFNDIGGDMATMKLGNRYGLPTTPGGSVLQRALRWQLYNYAYRNAVMKAYVKYISGKEPTGSVGRIGSTASFYSAPVFGKARRAKKLTLKQFQSYVGRAANTDEDFSFKNMPTVSNSEMEIIREAAEELRKIFKAFGDEAQKLQMFDVQKRIADDIEFREKSIERDIERMQKYKGKPLADVIKERIDLKRTELEELKIQQSELNEAPVMPPKEKYFVPRIYDLGAIKERTEEFIDVIAKAFARENEIDLDEVAKFVSAKNADKFDFETGKPVIVEGYHGSHKAIDEFDAERLGEVTGAESATRGFFFTSREQTAKYYARLAGENKSLAYKKMAEEAKARGETLPPQPPPVVNKRFLNLRNPFVVDMKRKFYRENTYSDLIAKAKAGGHDGLIIKNTFDSKSTNMFDSITIEGRFKSETIFVSFKGDQISKNAPAPSVRDRAADWVNSLITRGSVDDFAPGAGGPVNLTSRKIPLTNEELADWIVWDGELLLGIYSRRMGAAIEMNKKFGNRNLDVQLDELRVKLEDKGYTKENIDSVIEIQTSIRDKVLGRFHGSDPMSWSNRTVRSWKNYGNLTTMGKGIVAQLNDMARAMAMSGHEPLIKAFKTAWDLEFKQLAGGRYAKQGGEALEYVNARWIASLIEDDSALTVTQQSHIERGLAASQAPFFKYNLMNPFTVIWKDFMSVMYSHMIIDESIIISNAIRSGKTLRTLSKKEKRIQDRLASFGIDLRMAQTIADMPYEKTNGGLYLANIENWTGRSGKKAKEIFLGAMSGTVRTGVVTPGPTQRADIMDGVITIKGKRKEIPFAQLPFQLMSFPVSSSAKITHALLSGRDRNRAVTVASLLMSGYFSAWLSMKVSGLEKTWERMSAAEAFYMAFEKSGLTGYLFEVPKKIEDLTGYGPRSAMGFYEFGEEEISDEIGAVAGPAIGTASGMIEAFINPDLSDNTRAKLIRRGVPWAGLWVWDEQLREMGNWAIDSGWIPDPDANIFDLSDEEAIEVESD